VAQRADGRNRHAVGGGLESHRAEELGGRPDQAGGEVDAPDADAGRLFGQRQRLVTEGVVGQPFDERAARLRRGSRGGINRRSRGVPHVAPPTLSWRFGYHESCWLRAPFRGRNTWNDDAPRT